MISALLIAALIHVESHGNDRALGDYVKGHPTAFGCLQISHGVLDDVHRLTRLNLLSIGDCFDRETSIWVCRVYLDHYCTAIRLGREPTDEDRARCWNGGPDGWRKPETGAYWFKVQTAMDVRQRIISSGLARAP